MMVIFFMLVVTTSLQASMEPSLKICAKDYQEIKTLIAQENFDALSQKIYLLAQDIPEELVLLSHNHYEAKKIEYENSPPDAPRNLSIINAWSIASFLTMEHAAHSLEKPFSFPPKA